MATSGATKRAPRASQQRQVQIATSSHAPNARHKVPKTPLGVLLAYLLCVTASVWLEQGPPTTTIRGVFLPWMTRSPQDNCHSCFRLHFSLCVSCLFVLASRCFPPGLRIRVTQKRTSRARHSRRVDPARRRGRASLSLHQQRAGARP